MRKAAGKTSFSTPHAFEQQKSSTLRRHSSSFLPLSSPLFLFQRIRPLPPPPSNIESFSTPLPPTPSHLLLLPPHPSSARARACPSPRTSNGFEHLKAAHAVRAAKHCGVRGKAQAQYLNDPVALATQPAINAVETTHRPLCSRHDHLCSRAKMIASAPSVAHLFSGPSPGN